MYARLDGNTVVEIIEPFFIDGVEVPMDDRFPPDLRATMRPCPDDCAVGWVLDGRALVPPPALGPPAPKAERVSMRQARLALLAAGKLADVGTAISKLPSPQKEAALIEWEFARDVERSAPLVALLAQGLGLTEAQLDDLFTTAAEL